MRVIRATARFLSGLLIAVLAVTAAAAAESRIALVIGNAAYEEAPLKNPVNDARAMAAMLERLGFEVTLLADAGLDAMEDAILAFGDRIGKGNAGLFYYAGHGIQAHGRNYLIPVDAAIRTESRLRVEAVDVGLVTEIMGDARNRVNIVILDACRNNPFVRRMRGASRGLAAVDAASGTLIAYATAPGSVAADGQGDNGLYTTELLKALEVPGLKAEEVFKQVRVRVADVTRGAQTPWESSSLTGDFIFNQTIDVKVQPPPTGSQAAAFELAYWNSIKDSGNPADFEAYLEEYSSGGFVRLARNRLEALRERQSALAVSPKPAVELEPVEAKYVAVKTANVRERPTVDSAKVATLERGSEVYVAGKVKDKNWYRVERGDKPLGYVFGDLLKDAETVRQEEARRKEQERKRAQEAKRREEERKRTERRVQITRLTAAEPLGIDFGRYHALVIGNNDYQHLRNLTTAVGDAEAVATLLEDKYGFKVTKLINSTRREIVTALNGLRRSLTENDNLLIYYAGHGVLDAETETGFWLPTDAERDNDANWIANDYISRTLRAMTANHVMVVADSCYSGTLVRATPTSLKSGAERAEWLARMASKRSRTALVSGGLEPVMDRGGGGHSVFAKAFLAALEENDGVLEGQELFTRVSRPVVVNSDQTPDYSDIRRAGHEKGDFLFVRR